MAGVSTIAVEEVSNRRSLKRFAELPYALHREEPRWAPPVVAYDRARLDPSRNPFFDEGDGAYFLAWKAGSPAGRITAHLARPGAPGQFGFFDAVDDADVVAALLERARGWLRDRGCTFMRGPSCFTHEQEGGILTAGFEQHAASGRPWHPPWYAERLVEAGLTPASTSPTYRHGASQDAGHGATLPQVETEMPPEAGTYTDPRLARGEGDDLVVAIPDVAPALRAAGLRSAWEVARRARQGDWSTCVVRRWRGDPTRLLEAIRSAAHEAGYAEVIAPWGGPGREETVHTLFEDVWG